jgi:hypothetical protein
MSGKEGFPLRLAIFQNTPRQAHTQALFKGLLIHLDDPNEEIQASKRRRQFSGFPLPSTEGWIHGLLCAGFFFVSARKIIVSLYLISQTQEEVAAVLEAAVAVNPAELRSAVEVRHRRKQTTLGLA